MSQPVIIDLWVWSLAANDAAHDRLSTFLDTAELARASRFMSETHQRQFRIAHGRLREILAAYVSVPPDQLRFDLGSHGKPELTVSTTSAPFFNLSHTGALAALAVSPTHPLGVDIEAERDVTDNLAERYFAREEIEALALMPEAEARAAFFRCWTRKEAVVKAAGDGLSMPLTSFVVDVTDTDEMPLIRGPRGDDGALWRILNFRPTDLVAGAIAIKTNGAPVVLRRRGLTACPAD
ncbi:MAG: 4'-phosphopantetheinyl transferase superfamily protein [Hyphomicrobiaceae bacterium]